jgi:hypothetical protein
VRGALLLRRVVVSLKSARSVLTSFEYFNHGSLLTGEEEFAQSHSDRKSIAVHRTNVPTTLSSIHFIPC